MTKKIFLTPLALAIMVMVAEACGSSNLSPNPVSQLPKTPPNSAALPPTPGARPSTTVSTTPKLEPKPAGPITSAPVEPTIDGENYSIAVSDVLKYWNVYFTVQTKTSNEGFMAYTMDGKEIYVRASICVPCRGRTYSLNDDILECDTCFTTFSAKTGAGILGSCKGYPKASVNYQIIDGRLVMKQSDLLNAWEETLKPG